MKFALHYRSDTAFPRENVPKTEALVTWEELPFVVADRYMVSVIHACKSGAGAAFTIVAGMSLFTVIDTLTSSAPLFFQS